MADLAGFELKFANIPKINLRVEFDRTYDFVNSEEAERALRPPLTPIQTSVMTWHGMPADLFTLLLQRSILGVESYLSSALWYASHVLGVATSELAAKLRNPSAFGAKLLVSNIYHRMPEAVHPELSLRYQDQDLYERNLLFYKQVRNPIFHGKQLDSPNTEGLREAFGHLSQIFGWIDHWHPPDATHKNPIVIGPIAITLPKFKNRAP